MALCNKHWDAMEASKSEAFPNDCPGSLSCWHSLNINCYKLNIDATKFDDGLFGFGMIV